MANYSNLKNIIDQVVRTNGQGDITGANLNQTLQQMVTDLGANYQYAGVATPSTNPGSPDQNVFYIATLAGTYSYFNGIVLPKGITVLKWSGSWSSTTLYTVDTGLTPNSEALVQSGTVCSLTEINLGTLVNGFVNSTYGEFVEATSYKRTDYLRLNSKKIRVVVTYNVPSVGIAFYDRKKRYIGGSDYGGSAYGTVKEITVPDGTYYFATCAINAQVSNMLVLNMELGDIVNHLVPEREGIDLYDWNEDNAKINLGTLVNGFVNSAYGEFVETTSYKRTDYLRLNSKKIRVVVTYNVPSVGIAFYDRKKRYIGGSDYGGSAYGTVKEITVPDGTYYFATCAINAQVSNMLVLNMELGDIINHLVPQSDNPCFYDGSNEARTFKKVLCIGDSLTEGRFDYTENGVTKEFTDGDLSWPAFFAAIAGRNTTNKGDAGQTTKTWWQLHQNDDLSGHDACIIALGRNDYVPGRETTSEERIQYMTNIVNKVKAENPQIKIFISTMLNYYTGASADAVNADMRTIASTLQDCYLIDISAYGKLIAKYDRYSHCTAVGYQKLGEYYFRYLSYIMKNNPTDFKNVQFVGTNRTYNP